MRCKPVLLVFFFLPWLSACPAFMESERYACEPDGSCPDGRVCEPSTSECSRSPGEERCSSETDCGPKMVCTDGWCAFEELRMPDTGQITCFNDTVAITCPTASHQHFFGQDAHHGWDLEVAPEERFVRHEPVEDEPIVFDRFTRIEWQGCPAGRRGGDCSDGAESAVGWAEALAYCRDLEWGGRGDWELPRPGDLTGIANFDAADGATYLSIFPATGALASWSALQDAQSSAEAWAVSGMDGTLRPVAKSTGASLRCARGSIETEPGLLVFMPVLDEPVVEDTVTGLMWQGCPAERRGSECAEGSLSGRTWEEALAYCKDLSWSGHDDWRLPNINELQSTADLYGANPAIDTQVFPASTAEFFWSSTTWAGDPRRALGVHFLSGETTSANGGETIFGKAHWARTRCVRGGDAP